MADFEFEPEKATAVIAYLAQMSGETMYTILKMVYVVDRLHLERYGRSITGDIFFALPEGACPIKIYDSMKALRGDASYNYLPNSGNYLRVDRTTHDVEIKKMPLLDVLSATDIECLEETIAILKTEGRWHMRDLAHDEVWKSTSKNSQMALSEIAKSTSDGESLSRHLASRF